MLGKDYPKIFRTTRKENGIGKNFSNALKHVFSDTSLGKKIYKGSLGSYNKLSSKFEKLFIPTKSSFKDLLNTTSRMSRSTSTDDFSLFTTSTVPSPSSSSSSSSSTASLRSTSQKKQFTSFHRGSSSSRYTRVPSPPVMLGTPFEEEIGVGAQDMDYVEAQENYGIEEENEVDAVNLDEDNENIAETPAVGDANVRSESVNLPPSPPSAPRPRKRTSVA
ncbi:hypothetical protein FXO37_25491 [Capsicum annuum]|nr:hypothetical protein FXO37_25491 [Capsicum annuum]